MSLRGYLADAVSHAEEATAALVKVDLAVEALTRVLEELIPDEKWDLVGDKLQAIGEEIERAQDAVGDDE